MTTLTQKLVGLPADHLRRLKAMAKKAGVKTNHLIRVAVRQYLEANGQ